MKYYRKIVDGICKAFEIIAGLELIAMILIIFYHVIMRYCFNDSPRWTEEVARLLMICFSFIAFMIGVRDKAHIALTIIVDHMPRIAQYVIEVIEKFLTLLFGVLMCYFSIPYMTRMMSNRLPATELPVGFQYMIPVVVGALITLTIIWQIAEQLRGGKTEAELHGESIMAMKEESSL